MTYLKIRRGKGRSGARWYVCVPVPKELQPILRKRTVEVGLNTDSKKEAQQKRYPVIARILADFDRARSKTITSAHIEEEAHRYLNRRLEEKRLTLPSAAFGLAEARLKRNGSFWAAPNRTASSTLPHRKIVERNALAPIVARASLRRPSMIGTANASIGNFWILGIENSWCRKSLTV
jgi:hypothetical protein